MSGEALGLRDQDLLEQAQAHAAAHPELMLPFTGELVRLDDPSQVAYALDEIRHAKRRLDELRGLLEALLRVESQRLGTKSLHLEGGLLATVSGGSRLEWDVPELLEGLEQVGIPAERLAALVTTEITYKVDARVAKQLEAASPAYAAVIARARSVEPAAWRVSVRR